MRHCRGVSQSYDLLLKADSLYRRCDCVDLRHWGGGLLPVLLQAAGQYQQRGKADDYPGHDMKCEVNRKDEIGVLAASLNEMAQRLSSTMERLQASNEQLQQDIEREREQEKQRIDFFTAVSHESKKRRLPSSKGNWRGCSIR